MHGPRRLRKTPRLPGVAVFEADCTECNRLTVRRGSSGRRRIRLHGARHHNLLHHGNEALLISLAQISHRLKMGFPRRPFHFPQQRGARPGQTANLRAAIATLNRAVDKAARLQALKRTGGRRAIERDIGRQRALIGGSALRQSRKQAILQRRNIEGSAFLLKQGDMDLMKPPDQVTGTLLERP